LRREELCLDIVAGAGVAWAWARGRSGGGCAASRTRDGGVKKRGANENDWKKFFFLLLETAVVAIRQAHTKKLFAQVVKKKSDVLCWLLINPRKIVRSPKGLSHCALCALVCIIKKKFEEIINLK
jgi:hypothetical protein